MDKVITQLKSAHQTLITKWDMLETNVCKGGGSWFLCSEAIVHILAACPLIWTCSPWCDIVFSAPAK